MRHILCLLVVGVLIFVLATSTELTVPTTPTTPIPEGAKPTLPTEDAECWYTSTLGRDYKGKVNRTRDGITCQRWDRNYAPHSNPFVHSADRFPEHTVSEAENYCRNPDGEPGGPWCYTTNRKTRWSYCNAPKCTASGPCSPGWEKSTAETCWKHFNEQRLGYYDAQRACRAIGAELVILPSRVDIMFFRGYKTTLEKRYNRHRDMVNIERWEKIQGNRCEGMRWARLSMRMWVGGRRSDGVLIWDGIRQERMNFTIGSIDLTDGRQYCVSTKFDETIAFYNYDFIAEECKALNDYICERA